MAKLFVGIALPPEALAWVSARQEEIRARIGVRAARMRWIRPASFHLTLKFLGEVAEPMESQVAACACRVAMSQPPLTIRLRKFGAFPAADAATVIWIGADETTDQLSALVYGLEAAFAADGFAREPRPFAAHLTIARTRVAEDMRNYLFSINASLLTEFSVKELLVFESRTTPQGARYHPRMRFPLGASPKSEVFAGN